VPETASWVDVLALDDLPVDAQRVVWVGMSRVLLCRTAEQLYAVSDICPHALQPLSGGAISDGMIVCPRHGARFDLCSGKPGNRVTAKPLVVYEVAVDQGRIRVGPRRTVAQ
jgi:3-phenylpropionate/trans-cinnamate dioxygenase ferredoxin subunit